MFAKCFCKNLKRSLSPKLLSRLNNIGSTLPNCAKQNWAKRLEGSSSLQFSYSCEFC